MTTKKSWSSVNWKFHGFWVAADFGSSAQPKALLDEEIKKGWRNPVVRSPYRAISAGMMKNCVWALICLLQLHPISRVTSLRRLSCCGLWPASRKKCQIGERETFASAINYGASSRRDDRWYSAFVYGLVNVFRFIISPSGAWGDKNGTITNKMRVYHRRRRRSKKLIEKISINVFLLICLYSLERKNKEKKRN